MSEFPEPHPDPLERPTFSRSSSPPEPPTSTERPTSSRSSSPDSSPPSPLPPLESLLPRALPADQPLLRARLRALTDPHANPSARAGRRPRRGRSDRDAARRDQPDSDQTLRADILQSIARLDARRASVPKVSYPPELPVSQRRDDLLALVSDHQVVIVCGETGSGKTTQLPKLCLELGRGVHAMIGHTQPRRIAARTVAMRVAEELDAPALVASKMRFDDRTDERTLVKVMTDGILLAETRSDPLLRRYDTIIVDEAHERSLNIDFLLGTLKRILPRRPDLKLIITSATIDASRFAEHFAGPRGPAPVIEVEGRTYPVEMRYEPRASLGADIDLSPEEHAADAAVRLIYQNQSDVLIFMPGEREIRLTAHALRLHPQLP